MRSCRAFCYNAHVQSLPPLLRLEMEQERILQASTAARAPEGAPSALPPTGVQPRKGSSAEQDGSGRPGARFLV